MGLESLNELKLFKYDITDAGGVKKRAETLIKNGPELLMEFLGTTLPMLPE